MDEKKDAQKQATKPFEEYAVDLDVGTRALVRAMYKIPVGKLFSKSEYESMLKAATNVEIV